MSQGAGTQIIKARSLGVVTLPFKFTTDGSGDPTTATASGNGWSVAKTATGVYTITLSEKYVSLDCAIAVANTADGDFNIEHTSDDVDAATPVVVLTAYNDAVAANIVSKSVHGVLYLNSSGTRSAP
jgi:hypothetical protein